MGVVRRLARTAMPASRAGAALWVWRHRDQIGGWAGYAARSAPRLAAGDTADVLAEGRLRTRLAADKRTRDVAGLDVRVDGGRALLRGVVERAAGDAAVEIATGTTGIRRVRDDLTSPTRRWRRRPARA